MQKLGIPAFLMKDVALDSWHVYVDGRYVATLDREAADRVQALEMEAFAQA